MAPETPIVRPRILIVSRRSMRKNKFIDFVGEYHLDLLVMYGAAPVIVPRVAGVDEMLDAFEPIHGVLLREGEDVDPSLYQSCPSALSPDDAEVVRRIHAGEIVRDDSRDSIELRLAKLCLTRRIPFLGICRGSQVLNVAAGGTLHEDVALELGGLVTHINYENYDGHRHSISVVAGTPLHAWFRESTTEDKEGGRREIMVNSYHHQGVKKLGERFVAMGFAGDGLVEGFYDPHCYNPEEGKFMVGLQFHPERLRDLLTGNFDYPGCPLIYEDFVRAAATYARNLPIKIPLKYLDQLMMVARSIQNAKGWCLMNDKRLKQMGVTVRNASAYLEMKREREQQATTAARVLEDMSV